METYKPILDACCGGKMFYFDKNDPRVLFQDIRCEETTLCDGRTFSVKPDVIGDFTSMDFPDNTFNMVVFDPPHLRWWGKNPEKKPTGFQQTKYGTLRADWKDTLAKGFAECFRVLRPGGFLIFKWNEHDIKVSTILKLTDQKPIFGHKSGKRANTHWICFMKNGEHGTITNEDTWHLPCEDCEGRIALCNNGKTYLQNAITAWNNNDDDLPYFCFKCFKELKKCDK